MGKFIGRKSGSSLWTYFQKCFPNENRKEVKGMADISIIQSGSRYLLSIGSEKVEVSDYKIQSSADGETELCVTIKGVPMELELKASLTE